MSRSFGYALGAVAVVAAVLAVRSFASQRDAEWQMRVERETARAEEALAIGDSLRVEAKSYEEVADSLAVEAERRDTVIVTMIEELPAPPADCEPYTAPRDSVIAEMAERHNDISAAFEAEREAAALLRAAEQRARMAGDSLLAVLDARPRPLSPLIPSVGLGCTAGLSPLTRQADVVCGLSLNWEVKLF
jgi:hypothetical protein